MEFINYLSYLYRKIIENNSLSKNTRREDKSKTILDQE